MWCGAKFKHSLCKAESLQRGWSIFDYFHWSGAGLQPRSPWHSAHWYDFKTCQRGNGLVSTVRLVVDLAAFAVHITSLSPVACPLEYHGSGTEGNTHICILSILDLFRWKIVNAFLLYQEPVPRFRSFPCLMVEHRPLQFYMQKPVLYHGYWKTPSCFHQGMGWQHDNRVNHREKEKERSERERGKEMEKAEQLQERRCTWNGRTISFFSHWPFDSGKRFFEFAPRNESIETQKRSCTFSCVAQTFWPSLLQYIIAASLWGLSIEVVSATKTNNTKIHAAVQNPECFVESFLCVKRMWPKD